MKNLLLISEILEINCFVNTLTIILIYFSVSQYVAETQWYQLDYFVETPIVVCEL